MLPDAINANNIYLSIFWEAELKEGDKYLQGKSLKLHQSAALLWKRRKISTKCCVNKMTADIWMQLLTFMENHSKQTTASLKFSASVSCM